ncbi:MAG: 3-ketoacyl-ACP reductase FabG2 [Puniceicoccales bacterium]|jgi:3-oxoacyl-[acyl-carrier protein] reductase|nr:3-ketoacyl-ACP reductase FabG2 [Puniceicoccales bacterium]
MPPTAAATPPTASTPSTQSTASTAAAPSPRTVLVTGASKGIGAAIARQLAADGFAVTAHYHTDRAGAERVLADISAANATTASAAARLLQFDIRDRAQCEAALAADIAAHGPYYGVVLNAGIARDAAFPALSGDDWDDVLRTDLDGFYNVLRPCVMPMIGERRGGRIVTLSSVSGIMGNRGQVNYSAAKAGIIGATKALAVELARRKITVNCVAPGLIDTGMLAIEPEALAQAMQLIPAARIGTPAEVAALVAFLVSDRAAYITRQVISINGGML